MTQLSAWLWVKHKLSKKHFHIGLMSYLLLKIFMI